MGEYECLCCDEEFYLDEPPWDGVSMCDKCRGELIKEHFYFKGGNYEMA
jgi:hypothetical protein|tara:strand:+ start:82 stop:228 length:147 start_codon:yes stop_codon:yes gene_type:complete